MSLLLHWISAQGPSLLLAQMYYVGIITTIANPSLYKSRGSEIYFILVVVQGIDVSITTFALISLELARKNASKAEFQRRNLGGIRQRAVHTDGLSS